jgi:hypothetical protein
VLTIMRHRFLDMAERTRDAIESAKCVPLEKLSKWAHSDARAEQMCFVKEALGLVARSIGGASQRFLAHPGGRDSEGMCGF